MAHVLMCTICIMRIIRFPGQRPNTSFSLPIANRTSQRIPTIIESMEEKMLRRKAMTSEFALKRPVASPYAAANKPMIKIDVIQNDPRYAMVFTLSCSPTAGKTPKIPPGPAMPCTIPIDSATSFCAAGFSIEHLFVLAFSSVLGNSAEDFAIASSSNSVDISTISGSASFVTDRRGESLLSLPPVLGRRC